jgi:hypothetical protein
MDGSVRSPRRTHQGDCRLLLRGLDSLYVSYYLDVRCSALDFDELEHLKQRLRQSRTDEFAELRLGSETFALRPYGRKPYRYVFGNDAFEIHLAEHMRPACHVQFRSEGLWLLGLDALRTRFEAWCSSLKLVATKPEVISRADWAFDYHLPAPAFLPEHFVSKSAKRAVWHEHGRLQTVLLGTSDVVIRIYDKVAEITQASGKAWLFELWGQSEDVWRIEFQVRRARLRDGGITRLDDLPDTQSDLLRELSHRHTSLRTPSEDKNRSRWPMHPLWRTMREHIVTMPQTGLVRAYDPERPLAWRMHQQGKSLYGHLKGLAALRAIRRGSALPFEDVLAALPGILERHHNAHVWEADVERRVSAYRLGQW